MTEQKNVKDHGTKWIYMVYNWDSPVGCFTSASTALACCVVVSKNWKESMPNVALRVVRYAPAPSLSTLREEDLTDLFMRQLKTYKKVCNG